MSTSEFKIETTDTSNIPKGQQLNVFASGGKSLTLNSIAGKRIAILGTSGSGKSYTAAVLLEELLVKQVSCFIVDPEGEYVSLKQKYPIKVVNGINGNLNNDIKDALTNNTCLILSLVGATDLDIRVKAVTLFVTAIYDQMVASRRNGIIVLEEGHQWLPQNNMTDAQKACRDKINQIAAEGRKKGASLIIISQRTSKVHKDSLTQCNILFLHRVTFPQDLSVYNDLLPLGKPTIKKEIPELLDGECYIRVDSDGYAKGKIRIRHTTHTAETPSFSKVGEGDMSASTFLIDDGSTNINTDVDANANANANADWSQLHGQDTPIPITETPPSLTADQNIVKKERGLTTILGSGVSSKTWGSMGIASVLQAIIRFPLGDRTGLATLLASMSFGIASHLTKDSNNKQRYSEENKIISSHLLFGGTKDLFNTYFNMDRDEYIEEDIVIEPELIEGEGEGSNDGDGEPQDVNVYAQDRYDRYATENANPNSYQSGSGSGFNNRSVKTFDDIGNAIADLGQRIKKSANVNLEEKFESYQFE